MRPYPIKSSGSVLAVGFAVGLLVSSAANAQESAPETAPDTAAETAPDTAAEAAPDTAAEAPAPAHGAAERELFALNLYHEARSEGRDGMIAVGWVVLNRIPSDAFPDSITAVINEPTRRGCQWGWTCDGRPDTPTEMEKWELAQEVTDLLLSEARPADPTGGAVAFHETFRRTPGWLRRGGTRTVTLGNHHFYRLN
jgi:N-acetylmuramoyl-L-alanine amidase